MGITAHAVDIYNTQGIFNLNVLMYNLAKLYLFLVLLLNAISLKSYTKKTKKWPNVWTLTYVL